MTLNARFILKCAEWTARLRSIRLLLVSDSTIRIDVARGGGGEWAGEPRHPLHVGS